jgi:TPR repeat protein
LEFQACAQLPRDDTSYWRSKTVSELRDGAEKGNAVAQRILANAYLNGDSVKADAAEAAKWFRLAADQNDALAQLALGMMCAEGEGVARSKAEAAKWYRMAAEKGLVEAQVNLSNLYSRGEGVPQDDAEALKWMRKAAESGDILGQANLGFALLEGRGGPKNALEAVRWLRPAAYGGSMDASYRLGLMYAEGEGVEKDKEAALVWFTRAAERGHRDANYMAAYAYLTGPIEQRSKAIPFLQKGADLGQARCQLLLGLMLLKGELVPVDAVAGKKWLTEAGQRGETQAKAILDEADDAKRDEAARALLASMLGQPAAKTNALQAAAGPIGLTNATLAMANVDSATTNPVVAQVEAPGQPEPVKPQVKNPAPESYPSPAPPSDHRIALIIAVSVATSLASVFGISFVVFAFFKTRVAGLQRELKGAREQITLVTRQMATLVDHIGSTRVEARQIDLAMLAEPRDKPHLPLPESNAGVFKAKRQKPPS